MAQIPKDFYQKEDDSLVEACKVCGQYLLDEETPYLLEKAIKKFSSIKAEEVIFEMAICLNCAQQAQSAISKQSKIDVEAFLSSPRIKDNILQAMEKGFFEEDVMLNYCMVTGMSKDDIEEFQIMAHCTGRHLTEGSQAFMISSEGLEEIQSILSKETKDELERFREENFGVPPEFEHIFNGTDLVML